MSNGAWDYPANTRGYTPSIVFEYVTPKHELRYGFSLMPPQANGNEMNWNINKASSHTLEYTYKYATRGKLGRCGYLPFLQLPTWVTITKYCILIHHHLIYFNRGNTVIQNTGFALTGNNI